MAIGYAVAIRNAKMDAIAAALDAGSAPGKLRIYNGTRPATGGVATTLLAELLLSDPSAPPANAGQLTLNAINNDPSANAAGVASWFRMVDSNDNFVLDGAASAAGNGGDLILNDTNIGADAPVSVSSAIITEGNP